MWFDMNLIRTTEEADKQTWLAIGSAVIGCQLSSQQKTIQMSGHSLQHFIQIFIPHMCYNITHAGYEDLRIKDNIWFCAAFLTLQLGQICQG